MNRALLVFLAGVLAVKVIVALQLDSHPLLQPSTGLDTSAYVDLAKRVVDGDLALGPGLYYVSPLYIYFLALVYGATESFTAARVLQAAPGTLAVLLIFLTAREWFGRRAAWMAMVLAALTGVITWYEGLILQASLDVVLTAAALWLMTLALRRDRPRFYLAAGFVFGVASLNRPNLFLSALCLVMLLLATRRFRPGVLLLAGVIAGLAPVTLRNIIVADQWSLVSSHGGINFYIGNGEGATGYFHAVPGMRSTVDGLALDARRVAETARGRRLSDAEVSAYYSDLTWAWIRSHPGDWVRLLIRKTYGLFNAAHVSIPFSYTFYAFDAGTLLRFCVAGPWLLIPLGVFGLVRAAPRPLNRDYLVWVSFVPSYAASVILFFITERYKLPLYVPLAIGAGAALDLLIREFQSRRMRPLLTNLAVVAVLFAAANWPLHLDDGRYEERLRMAEVLAGRGEVAEAERWTAMALKGPLDPATAHDRVGGQFLNSNTPAAAIPHLQETNQLRPGDARIEYLLGRALLIDDRPSEAVPHLRKAIEHRVDAPLAGYDLAVALEESGDPAGAAKALSAVEPPPDATVDVWLQLGKRAGSVNAPDVAERFFRRAVAIAPDNARAHHLLGLDLLVLQRYEEAAHEFETAARLDPRNAESLATLAYCEERLSRHAEARRHAEAALALDPSHAIARKVLAKLGTG